MRYNTKFIEARFGMAMDAIGVKHGDTYTKREDGYFGTSWFQANVGTYFIDNNSAYGGRQIRKISTDGGGESMPFGSNRYTASEFVALLDGILGAAHIMRTGA